MPSPGENESPTRTGTPGSAASTRLAWSLPPVSSASGSAQSSSVLDSHAAKSVRRND